MPRTVLLHHMAAECGDHSDWLLAPDDAPYGPDERVLIAFRVAGRIDRIAAGGWFEAQRIADHRWLYLTYEGEITRGRGRVERVAAGIWTPGSIEDDAMSGRIEWEGRAPTRFAGRLIDADRWRFQIDPPLCR